MQGVQFVASRRTSVGALARRYGPAFTLNLPIFGKTVLISDPALIKDLFTTGGDLVGRATNLGEVLGPGSTFSLDRDAHRERRKLLVPPFHGKRMHGYEGIVEEEVMREIATWPEGVEFETLPSMMRITLNAILRAVFGAEGEAFEELRTLLPRAVEVGSRLVVLPRFFRRDFGPRSPGGMMRRYRRRYDEIIDGLIAEALADPHFDERSDVLSLMLRARHEDGSQISHRHVADELLTLLTAGHETTATTLAWLVERVSRHPALLARLTQEADAGGSRLQQATIWEVQRVRPVIDGTSRRTLQRIRLGEWVIPEGYVVMVSIALAHAARDRFPEPSRFDPRPVRRLPAGQLHLDSVRRRHPAVHRSGVREHGDDRGPANPAAGVHHRADVGARRGRIIPAGSRMPPAAAGAWSCAVESAPTFPSACWPPNS